MTVNAPQYTDRLWGGRDSCPYDDVIDARSPAEFADDHIPGAVNLPVLSDAERAEVGTLYHQTSAFAARRHGAALVSTNIAGHLRSHFAAKEKDYRPFVYCWRGGERSRSLATILASVGWRVTVLTGGYRTYRSLVLRGLADLPRLFTFRVVAGMTGTAKTRLLHALAARGEQMLDLEALAGHRGSVLGGVGPQPPQRLFESRLIAALGRLDPSAPVWVEAESNRIGDRFVPPAVWAGMRAAEGIEVRVPTAARVRHLLTEYRNLTDDPDRLKGHLRQLANRHGLRRVGEWERLADEGRWEEVVRTLLASHYDPGYAASQQRFFPRVTEVMELTDVTPADLNALAETLAARTLSPKRNV